MKRFGYKLRFDCKNGEQYESIGRFWDAMAELCGRENLFGVGYGWQNDTICYLIGTKDNVPESDLDRIGKLFEGIEAAELELPDDGWITYRGRTDQLAQIYEDIYKQGSLSYEIEQFFDDGSCEIAIIRLGSNGKEINKVEKSICGAELAESKKVDDAAK